MHKPSCWSKSKLLCHCCHLRMPVEQARPIGASENGQRERAWLVPRVRARLVDREISVRNSCAPAICNALPIPVTHRHASSCPKVPDIPHPIIPARKQTFCRSALRKSG